MRGSTTAIFVGDDPLLTIPADSADLGSARAWMREYADRCEQLEVDDLRSRRVVPVQMPLSSEEIRLLWAIESLGGACSVTDARSAIVTGFGKGLDVLNVARVARAHPEHVYFEETTDALVLHDSGKRYLGAFKAFDRRAVGRRSLPIAATTTDGSE
jgi:hypothetical protein